MLSVCIKISQLVANTIAITRTTIYFTKYPSQTHTHTHRWAERSVQERERESACERDGQI